MRLPAAKDVLPMMSPTVMDDMAAVLFHIPLKILTSWYPAFPPNVFTVFSLLVFA
jgi:hypothetical protein